MHPRIHTFGAFSRCSKVAWTVCSPNSKLLATGYRLAPCHITHSYNYPSQGTSSLNGRFPPSLSSGFKTFSLCQSGYEIPDFVRLEHTPQLRSRTILASHGREVPVPIELGLRRCLPAQEAPSLARPVRCRWYGGLVVTILTDPRCLGRPHRWRRWIRVTLLPCGPSKQRIDCRNRRGHDTYTDLHV